MHDLCVAWSTPGAIATVSRRASRAVARMIYDRKSIPRGTGFALVHPRAYGNEGMC